MNEETWDGIYKLLSFHAFAFNYSVWHRSNVNYFVFSPCVVSINTISMFPISIVNCVNTVARIAHEYLMIIIYYKTSVKIKMKKRSNIRFLFARKNRRMFIGIPFFVLSYTRYNSVDPFLFVLVLPHFFTPIITAVNAIRFSQHVSDTHVLVHRRSVWILLFQFSCTSIERNIRISCAICVGVWTNFVSTWNYPTLFVSSTFCVRFVHIRRRVCVNVFVVTDFKIPFFVSLS